MASFKIKPVKVLGAELNSVVISTGNVSVPDNSEPITFVQVVVFDSAKVKGERVDLNSVTGYRERMALPGALITPADIQKAVVKKLGVTEIV